MEQIDMVEKLHEKANISLSEARDVLERANWDMLEALVLLEKEGKIQPLTTSVSTVDDESTFEHVKPANEPKQSKWSKFWEDVMENLKSLVNKCFTCSMVMRNKKGSVIHIPLFILVILCFVSLSCVAVGLLLGLLVGYNYSIEENREDENQ